MLRPDTPSEAVANGAQFLDRVMPDWHQRIDLPRLDLMSNTHCILGQLYRSLPFHRRAHGFIRYYRVIDTFDLTRRAAAFSGFDCSEWADWQIKAMENEWEKAIDARRQMEVKDSARVPARVPYPQLGGKR